MRALLLLLFLSVSARAQGTNDIEVLAMPSSSPLVTFRILLRTGSAYDSVGKEGLAALTASMISEGGSEKLAYEEILKQMYPLATSFGAQVDKEMTVFVGTTHVDNLQKYYNLIRQMLLTPGFREDDLSRLKEDAMNFMKVTLREGNDEE